MQKPKVGLYIDDSNMYYLAKVNGWKVDYKKLHKWVADQNEIVHAKYFMGMPSWEPARSINQALAGYYAKIGYKVITKPLKKIKDTTKPSAFRNKCNFDVEMHDEVMRDLLNLDIVYIATGESDFVRTKERVLGEGKKIKFLLHKKNSAWELRIGSWHVKLDDIRSEIEKGGSS